MQGPFLRGRGFIRNSNMTMKELGAHTARTFGSMRNRVVFFDVADYTHTLRYRGM